MADYALWQRKRAYNNGFLGKKAGLLEKALEGDQPLNLQESPGNLLERSNEGETFDLEYDGSKA